MLQFESSNERLHLVVNWEAQLDDPSDCVEISIAPGQLPVSVNDQGIAMWREEDLDEVSSVCVYNGGLRFVLSALQQGLLVAATLPLVTGCESQLSVELTGVPDRIRLLVREIYPPQRSRTFEVTLSEVIKKLFPDG